jgi:hypothetical protein
MMVIPILIYIREHSELGYCAFEIFTANVAQSLISIVNSDSSLSRCSEIEQFFQQFWRDGAYWSKFDLVDQFG